MTDPTRISVVIPTYAGQHTLPVLIEEIEKLRHIQAISNKFVISEVLLVHDCGRDRSDKIIENLAEKYSFVRPVWLSRNYGQHAATMAGMASATGDWVVTMDEDGQHDPACIEMMLDVALNQSLQLVYAEPVNPPPHGPTRNFCSRATKLISTRVLGNQAMGRFNSF